MNYRLIIAGFMLNLLLIVISCVPRAAPSLPATGPGLEFSKESAGSPPVSREEWVIKWESSLKEAQKEGKIVVYGSSQAAAVREALPSFKDRYGFTIEILTGRGAEVRAKILQERASGLFLPDVFMSGLNTIYGAVKASGATVPFESFLLLPEVRDEKAWLGGKLPWGDTERHVFKYTYEASEKIALNTELVKPGDIKSMYDLLDPKWTGRIVINDPTIGGTAFSGFANPIYYKILDLDFFRQLLSKQKPQVLSDERIQVDGLAKGKYSIALWPRNEAVVQYMKAGAPITWGKLKEVEFVSTSGGGLTVLKNRPHPNATTIFINWLLSKEGQLLVQKVVQRQSARIDIPTEGLDPATQRQPGVDYLPTLSDNEEWVLKEQPKYIELAKQVFSPFTR